MILETASLASRYEQLKQENPHLRIRNAAEQLGVSEMELLELELGGEVIRLDADPRELLTQLKPLGKIMALTRNEYVVHERKGVYENVSFMGEGSMGVAVNEDIDIRYFMYAWKHIYAVRSIAGNRTMHSFQFFDGFGEAIHKIYLQPQSDLAAYEELAGRYRAADQSPTTDVKRRSADAQPAVTEEAEIDLAAFQAEWLALQDTHDFFSMLKKHNVSRIRAMRTAPEGHTRQLSKDAFIQMFEKAAQQELPIMVFVGNKACIQIHTGTVKRLVPMDGWFNVMDPDFNLHVRLEGIDEVWEVRKPTRDGIVTAVEVYDAAGELIVYCFGKRKPGIPELQDWRTLVSSLS